MKNFSRRWPRRHFLQWTARTAATVPLWPVLAQNPAPSPTRSARVALLPCKTYEVAALKAVYEKSFDLLGGIRRLVNGKTVTIKVNLTATNFMLVLNRPPGESYMTHFATVAALTAVLFKEGARRVRLVESTNSRATLRQTLELADWDVKALEALGPIEFENTRNLGSGKRYAELKVPGGGYMFSAFHLNQAYADTDVMVSLCKMKDHITAGVTLSLKNLFGITPNSLYSEQSVSEAATAGRMPLHGPGFLEDRDKAKKFDLPGLKKPYLDFPADAGYRVPHTVADICAARPIDLAIIDGITTMTNGEGWWCEKVGYTEPGVMIVGLDPVATDAVGVAVMGYPDPQALRGKVPFEKCDNHLRLAEQAGLGTADLKQIEVVGHRLEKAIHPYPRSPLAKRASS